MNTATLIRSNNLPSNSTATGIAGRPETVIESKVNRLSTIATDFDSMVQHIIERLQPVIVAYPTEMQPAAVTPQVMQCEHAQHLEGIADHLESSLNRLRSAMGNVQL